MRRLARKIIQILDGTPAVYGQRQRGQSIIEMAFITPLLVIMVAGVVEIGWLANNYLTLQEVTRVGARRGTVLVGDFSPIAWNEGGSLLPAAATGDSIDPFYDPLDPVYQANEALRVNVRQCSPANLSQFGGFYNIIICTMLDSMDPLELRGDNDIDDIVVSVFAVQTVLNDPAGDYDFETSYAPLVDIDEYEPGYIPVVVGRWPTVANECNVLADDSQWPIFRDPFDFINDGLLTINTSTSLPIELAREVSGSWLTVGQDDDREQQIGFAWRGQHKLDPITVNYSDGSSQTFEVDCWGSEWTSQEIQELMKVEPFDMSADELAANPGIDTGEDLGLYLPNEGVVLVEMWWQHDLLLNLPVYSPVLEALGDDNTTLYVWAAFPVPSVEPSIVFDD
jgi:hypothetical protein